MNSKSNKAINKFRERHIIFATCFLKGAIPSSIIRDLKRDCYYKLGNPIWIADIQSLCRKQYDIKRIMIMQVDKLLDRRKIGPHFLQDMEYRNILKSIFTVISSQNHRILKARILSNHIHLLIEFSSSLFCNSSSETSIHTASKTLLKQIKKESAEKINANLNRIGPLWEEENFCIAIDSLEMFNNVRSYINTNTCYIERMKASEDQLLLSKTIAIKGKKTLVYSEFRPGIVC